MGYGWRVMSEAVDDRKFRGKGKKDFCYTGDPTRCAVENYASLTPGGG
jgi:hypothetical protein